MEISPQALVSEMMARLPYCPNEQQTAVAAALSRFVTDTRPDGVFILNGYAGTGKTSMTGALVRAYEALGGKTMLLAPTGRAAKVFSANSGGRTAWTIHRKIYRHNLDGDFSNPMPADNKEKNTLFVVDEASMIGMADENGVSLLHDLIQYVYSGEGCRMILMGDTAQLPPVGALRSPAMNPERLRELGLRVTSATMTKTARQAADSGILFNATRLRRTMAACKARSTEDAMPVPKLRALPDVSIVSGEELPDLLDTLFRRDGLENTIIITRSNRRASDYNAAIRAQVLYREEEISPADMLIVARNHYFRNKTTAGAEFIANGDIIIVERVSSPELRYGLSFADATVKLPDGKPFEIKLILNTLTSNEASLSRADWEKLYQGIMTDSERYGDMTVADRARALRTDPYWNALQVKFAYAVTCHKAQGGQWENVLVDLSYIPPEALGIELYRWLYTAVTRARTHLYLISPPPAIIEQHSSGDNE